THKFSTGYSPNQIIFFTSAARLFVWGHDPNFVYLTEDDRRVEPWRLEGRHALHAGCVAPDRRRMCLADNHNLGAEQQPGEVEYVSLLQFRLPDLDNEWEVRLRDDEYGWVAATSYSADGRWLACGDGSGRVTVHDAQTGRVRQEFHPQQTQELKAVAL